MDPTLDKGLFNALDQEIARVIQDERDWDSGVIAARLLAAYAIKKGLTSDKNLIEGLRAALARSGHSVDARKLISL